ncbi:UvrD-helicase domain-containing protein [Desulfovibrio litoralis]|uniref:TIGR00375 family protein n=1 Tax=Desulfovibrio litoralis DSM 11393 TaxID=1121455 RepID=A0A1M7SNY3_9BACT|nr:UvrD-helicase domain-containing protein [Desulfovibrio litoralis]SHN60155.1 TIGR00375 family protein [Desulfovibrio litoralis DSM 11393]
MQTFRADLHIHSRFSRATSSKLTAHYLAAWAKIKGLELIGTGDITHPVWREELKEKLVYNNKTGFYHLKNAVDIDHELPLYSGLKISGETNFILQGEISSVYKKNGKVRKIHNIVYFPNFEVADKFSEKLGKIGNISSDGRPTVGLDAKQVLEMVLESHPDSFLIPAHIWTPWFSLFGSKSGFDSVEECFGSLSEHIFALETGLSSNQEMNRLISSLDRFKLVSNSDAHSGENLGREANIFSGTLSYQGVLNALRGSDGKSINSTNLIGTIEFFPEEGKYHLDGHRKCNIVMEPSESRARHGICPVCGKPLTIGVLNRVLELADRETPVFKSASSEQSLIPLAELISEVVGTNSKSRRVSDMHARLISRFGAELSILSQVPEDELMRFSAPLGEAISRMRHGAVLREGGYDGEYGVVRVFSEKEQKELLKRGTLVGFSLDNLIVPLCPSREKKEAQQQEQSDPNDHLNEVLMPALPKNYEEVIREIRFNVNQKRALCSSAGPNLVIAGPGSGKTRTLIGRILHLIENSISIKNILALTFTRRAATEIDQRLLQYLGGGTPIPRVDTLYALAFEVWQNTHRSKPILLSSENALKLFIEANGEQNITKLRDNFQEINLNRERLLPLKDELKIQYQNYCQQKTAWNLADLIELLESWREQMDTGIYSRPWTHILVDEIQDLSNLQLALIKALTPPDGLGFFAVGDPDQSICSFQGAGGDVENSLRENWPHLNVIHLDENYRSTPELLELSSGFIRSYALSPTMHQAGLSTDQTQKQGDIRVFHASSDKSEAFWIGSQIKSFLGLPSHNIIDHAKNIDKNTSHFDSIDGKGEYSLSDIVVLVRTKELIPVIKNTLQRMGVPCSTPETEVFWREPRVEMIINAASRQFGINLTEEENLKCPEKIIAKGPLGIAAYFSDSLPFDALFWQSQAFKTLVKSFDKYSGWSGLINWISMQSELELAKNNSEKVQLLTINAAKGLEFKIVFLPGLEDGLIPFMGVDFLSGKLKNKSLSVNIDEERRIFYVGLTRAQDAVLMSYSSKREFSGHALRLKPSKFIHELPKRNILFSTLKAHHSIRETQLKLL